ncbi:MAG: sigma-70 family RNA polymerase sigma factor [Candidatus Polarisedimenticolaceae bacterium]|nr:sigma-70 family RNA polymerase sigma factor [Candidatus Polarisedimenticolaceae bacterium]
MSQLAQKQIKFEQLVNQWSTDLYRFAYWLSKEKGMAEDLVQETFLRAWKSIEQLQDPAKAKSWLFTILRREHARKFERKVIPINPDHAPETVAGKSSDDTSTEAFVLRQALEELAEEYREPLLLQVIGGYSMDEIADQLGLSKGAVMTRLFRARNKLRSHLEESS